MCKLYYRVLWLGFASPPVMVADLFARPLCDFHADSYITESQNICFGI